MTDKPTVHEALAAVMEDVRAVRKGDRNSQQGYQFRGIDAVVNAVGPALRKHGVIMVPAHVESHYRDVQTSTGKASRECTVIVTYRFYGPAGDSIDVMAPGESMDFGDKGAPKAMSVAMRIALLQALCLPTDDADPDSSSYERAAEPPPRAPAAPPRQDEAERALNQLKVEVWALAQRMEWTKEAMAADYADRYGGQVLAEATQAKLIDYRDVLTQIVTAVHVIEKGVVSVEEASA